MYMKFVPLMQKPEAVTTFSQSDCINNIYLEIKDLTPAMDGQYFPADRGQGHWPFQLISIPTLLYLFQANQS
jgi:hypothetical protein